MSRNNWNDGGQKPDVKPPGSDADLIADLRKSLDNATRKFEHEERAHEVTINQRDAAEEAISQAYYLVVGESPEWSNLFGYPEALEGIGDAVSLLKQTVVQLKDERDELRKIAIYIPGKVYIQAKEAAGMGVAVKANTGTSNSDSYPELTAMLRRDAAKRNEHACPHHRTHMVCNPDERELGPTIEVCDLCLMSRAHGEFDASGWRSVKLCDQCHEPTNDDGDQASGIILCERCRTRR